jgi:hypothetical protein
VLTRKLGVDARTPPHDRRSDIADASLAVDADSRTTASIWKGVTHIRHASQVNREEIRDSNREFSRLPGF